MSILKRAHVRGMVHELTSRGVVAWPSQKIAEDAADAIADNLPAAVIPEEGTPEEGLSAEEAAHVLDQIVDVAKEIASKTGGYNPEINKIASATAYEDAAAAAATALLEKAAAGDMGPQVEDMDNTTPTDLPTNQNMDVVVPQGVTDLNTTPGEVGKQVPAASPGRTDVTPNEVAKLSALLKLMSDNTGTHPQGEPGRTDLKDNLNMKVVVPQGTTHQTVPASAVVGAQQPHPKADDRVSVPNQLNKLSADERDSLRKLAASLLAKLSEDEECKEEEKKEEKKEEKAEEKVEDKMESKAAELLSLLRAAATK